MTRRYSGILWGFLLIILLVACQGHEGPVAAYEPSDLQLSGQDVLETATEFAGRFPNRASAEINNELAAEWLDAELTAAGWECISDEWQVINYSRPLPLQNIICQLPGASAEEIVVMAHYDHSPETIEGADNNASGVAILLQLAHIFAAEQPWPYTMVFVATDGQPYGMLGAQRLIATHPDPERIVAAISLDNLGLDLYQGLVMSVQGFDRGYGPLWLQQVVQVAAQVAGDLWVPQMATEMQQTFAQALPLAVTDQGPFVAQGVPAVALIGQVPDEFTEQYQELIHSPADTVDRLSAGTLHQGGRVAEALIRQLQGMEQFPDSFSPYLAYDGGLKIVPPPVFILMALILAGLFFLASTLAGRRSGGGAIQGLVNSLPHFLSLWLPFIASILLLYFFVAIGLLEKFNTYPATPKDALLSQPRWFVFIIWLIALWEFLQIGRRLGALYMEERPRPTFSQVRSLAFLVIGLAILFFLISNPLTTLAFMPLIAWLFIGDRQGRGKILDVFLFLVGGLFVYLLLYYLSEILLADNLRIIWYLVLGLSVRTIGFWSASMGFAVIAAGLALIIWPPRVYASATKDEPMAESVPGAETPAASE